MIYIMNGELSGVKNIKELLEYEEPLTNDELSGFKLPCYNMKSEDPAIILCSSGTTGTPKGVVCSHYTLLNKYI